MNLTVSSSPHIKGNDSTRRIMRDVVLATLPALVFGIVHFGLRALSTYVNHRNRHKQQREAV